MLCHRSAPAKANLPQRKGYLARGVAQGELGYSKIAPSRHPPCQLRQPMPWRQKRRRWGQTPRPHEGGVGWLVGGGKGGYGESAQVRGKGLSDLTCGVTWGYGGI